MAKSDIYQKVTNQIIKSLEAGIVPWQCPMEQDGGLAMSQADLHLNPQKAA